MATTAPSEVIRIAQTIWLVMGRKEMRSICGMIPWRKARIGVIPSDRAARVRVSGMAFSAPRKFSAG